MVCRFLAAVLLWCNWSDSVAQNLDFRVVTLQKDTVNLIEDTNKAYIFIFSNNNACRDCFRPLNRPTDYLNQVLNNKSYNIRFICRVDQNAGERRRHNLILQRDMPDIATPNIIFFDIYTDEYTYNKQARDGLFSDYQINQTPAIVLYRPGLPLAVFPYEILYPYLKEADEFSLKELIEFKDRLTTD